MPCPVCHHPERRAIDLALLSGTATLVHLSEQHRLSTSALQRHQQHLLKKTAQAQNRFQELLREGYLFLLNKFLEMVHGAANTARVEGNSRQLLQAVRQGTNIMKFMAKLDSSLTPDTVHRLLAAPLWAGRGFLPTDPQVITNGRQALADYLLTPCPEPDSHEGALVEKQTIGAELAELADLPPELLRDFFAGLPQVVGATAPGPHAARWEKSGKLAGKTASKGIINKEKQQVKQSEKNSASISLGQGSDACSRSGNWVEDLDAGRLSLDFLNAVGAGRPPLEPLPFPG